MTDTETLRPIVGAPEELEFVQGSKSQNVDFLRLCPEVPTQLPPELAGKQWPPPEK